MTFASSRRGGGPRKMGALSRVLGTVGLTFALGYYVYSLALRRARGPLRPSAASQRLLAEGRKRLLLKLLDVGGFFGVDIGGTLCKLMFFLPEKDLALGSARSARPSCAVCTRWRGSSCRETATARRACATRTFLSAYPAWAASSTLSALRRGAWRAR